MRVHASFHIDGFMPKNEYAIYTPHMHKTQHTHYHHHSLTHALTHSPSHPVTQSVTHSRSHLVGLQALHDVVAREPTQSLTYALTQSLTHPVTHSPSHSLTHSLTLWAFRHPLTHPPSHSPCGPSGTHSPSQSLTHPVTQSLTHSPSHSLTHLVGLQALHDVVAREADDVATFVQQRQVHYHCGVPTCARLLLGGYMVIVYIYISMYIIYINAASKGHIHKTHI